MSAKRNKVDPGSNEPVCMFDKKPCIKERCMSWVHIRGKHPQTNAEIDMKDCSFRWMPVLMLENAKEIRQTAAAVESARNDSRKGTAALASVLLRRPVTMDDPLLISADVSALPKDKG